MAGFKDILGHEQIIEHLQNAITMDIYCDRLRVDSPFCTDCPDGHSPQTN